MYIEGSVYMTYDPIGSWDGVDSRISAKPNMESAGHHAEVYQSIYIRSVAQTSC